MDLLRKEVRFTRLVRSLRKIESLTDRVDSSYLTVLERYPRSIRLLRSYAHFLEEVRGVGGVARLPACPSPPPNNPAETDASQTDSRHSDQARPRLTCFPFAPTAAQVKHDPWTASKYYQEADKLEDRVR